ncbi:DUF177 domain-containing protein [Shimazuella sp. AN120528]|uniref:YceD family protein n=1 Tax=Shimazuella soli TaxID=1892854 RepID=UPI001F0F37F2|nr:DUF177 domain-containing protein [Shimazuella soli]MCH5584958.1 DUF177 domain-containing protein [Shimazuella soli]
MIITINQINQTADGVYPFQGKVYLEDLVEEEPNIVKLEPIQVEGEASRLDSHLYQVSAKQKCVGKLICSRCLTTFPTSLESSWFEKFTDKKELAIDTEEETIHLLIDGQIELELFVREQLVIHLPYAPLCKPDCAGLCPECGANKNEKSCDCNTERIDPRLAKLQDLLEDKDSVS